MYSYFSLQKEAKKIIENVRAHNFSGVAHPISQEDRIYLVDSIEQGKKMVQKIFKMRVRGKNLDRQILRYVRTASMVYFLRDLYESYGYARDYCITYILEHQTDITRDLKKLLQSPDVWSTRIIPKQILLAFKPYVQSETRRIIDDVVTQENWEQNIAFELLSIKNMFTEKIIPHKKGIIKKI